MTKPTFSRRDLFRLRFPAPVLPIESKEPSYSNFTEQAPPGEVIFYDQLSPIDTGTLFPQETK